MKFAIDYFEIGPHNIEWGKTVNEIKEMAQDCGIKKNYPDGIHYDISEVLGFKAVSVSVYADAEDRPVSNVRYNLGREAQPNEYYLETLQKILHEPVEETITERCSSFHWDLPEASIYLVTYGEDNGKEDEDKLDGTFFAWMHIFLETDMIVRIIKPWRIKKQELETEIAEHSKGSELFIFNLHEEQRPIYYAHRDLQAELTTNPFTEKRLSQLELRFPEVIRTPEYLYTRLKSNEIALYKIEKLGQWAVCNKWDLILFDIKKTVIYEEEYLGDLHLRFNKDRDGYGKGDVGGFEIKDYRKDDLMSLIVKKAEEIAGHKIHKLNLPDMH
jgi:hypothetical protein